MAGAGRLSRSGTGDPNRTTIGPGRSARPSGHWHADPMRARTGKPAAPAVVRVIALACCALLAGCTQMTGGAAGPQQGGAGAAPADLSTYYDQKLSWGP